MQTIQFLITSLNMLGENYQSTSVTTIDEQELEARVQELLSTRKTCTETRDGITPAMVYAAFNRLDYLQQMPQEQLLAADDEGITPLWRAAEYGHAEIVEYLWKAGGDVNTRVNIPSSNYTPLHIAVSGNHVETIRILCKAGANLNETTDSGMTPLWLSAFLGHVESTKALCEAGADIDKLGHNGETALCVAAAGNHAEIVKVLCEAGADTNKSDPSGRTPLWLAVEYEHLSVVRLLCEAGTVVNKKCIGATPLSIAVEIAVLMQEFEIAMCLLKTHAGIGDYLPSFPAQTDFSEIILIGAHQYDLNNRRIKINPTNYPEAITTLEQFQQRITRYSLSELHAIHRVCELAPFARDRDVMRLKECISIYCSQHEQAFTKDLISILQMMLLQEKPREIVIMLILHLATNYNIDPFAASLRASLLYDNMEQRKLDPNAEWTNRFTRKNYPTFLSFWSQTGSALQARQRKSLNNQNGILLFKSAESIEELASLSDPLDGGHSVELERAPEHDEVYHSTCGRCVIS